MLMNLRHKQIIVSFLLGLFFIPQFANANLAVQYVGKTIDGKTVCIEKLTRTPSDMGKICMKIEKEDVVGKDGRVYKFVKKEKDDSSKRRNKLNLNAF